jgi:general secretion pathway protein G
MRLNQWQKVGKAARGGFTLLEVLLVVGILVALAAIAAPNFIGAKDTADRKTTKFQVSEFDKAFKLYNVTYDQFPDNSMGFAAITQPQNGRPAMLDKAVLNDPWGSAYQYQYPGTRNTSGGPDVWSNGPDRQSNTPDDIGNWPSQN